MYRKLNANSGEDRPAPKNECKCPYCSRRFNTPDELTLHIVTRHTQTGIRRGPAQAGTGSS